MPLRIAIAPRHPLSGDFAALDRRRSLPHEYFADLLECDRRLRGSVLDIGCGGDFPRHPRVRCVLMQAERVDGVEPDPVVEDHPHLAGRWCCGIEEADLPQEFYDAAIAFWVAEHLKDADAFLRKTHGALKPGGVLYAFTPHALHPFAVLSRIVNDVRLKSSWRGVAKRKINEYPAYYRVNRQGAIAPAADRAGFARAEFHYLPCVQWDSYFPRSLRFLPHVYDRALGIRFRRLAQILIFKLEKGD
jgi:SAM-dependent methyltransferase